MKQATDRQNQLRDQWTAVYQGAGQALDWIARTRGKDTPRLESEADSLNLRLRQARNQARTLRRVATRPMTVGFFGLSQAGKSYLISALAAGDDGEGEPAAAAVVPQWQDAAGRQRQELADEQGNAWQAGWTARQQQNVATVGMRDFAQRRQGLAQIERFVEESGVNRLEVHGQGNVVQFEGARAAAGPVDCSFFAKSNWPSCSPTPISTISTRPGSITASMKPGSAPSWPDSKAGTSRRRPAATA